MPPPQRIVVVVEANVDQVLVQLDSKTLAYVAHAIYALQFLQMSDKSSFQWSQRPTVITSWMVPHIFIWQNSQQYPHPSNNHSIQTTQETIQESCSSPARKESKTVFPTTRKCGSLNSYIYSTCLACFLYTIHMIYTRCYKWILEEFI